MIASAYIYYQYNRKGLNIADVEASAEVSADDLIRQFSQNESDANKKFLSKIIEVSGTVKKIETNETGLTTVVLGDNSSTSSVRCSIDSLQNESAKSIPVNAPVKLKGFCTGYISDELGLGADVILTNCSLVK